MWDGRSARAEALPRIAPSLPPPPPQKKTCPGQSTHCCHQQAEMRQSSPGNQTPQGINHSMEDTAWTELLGASAAL